MSTYDAPGLQSDMAVRISFGTYRIFWEAGSEDTIWRRWDDAEYDNLTERAKARSEERAKCKWLL